MAVACANTESARPPFSRSNPHERHEDENSAEAKADSAMKKITQEIILTSRNVGDDDKVLLSVKVIIHEGKKEAIN